MGRVGTRCSPRRAPAVSAPAQCGWWLGLRGRAQRGNPEDRHLFDRWLVHAERKAKLPKLEGGLWHPYRRKRATERKHLSITDVPAAGGLQDTATLLTCYQRPINDALLAVMSEERKVRDVAVLALRS